jgi:hypothetical protein
VNAVSNPIRCTQLHLTVPSLAVMVEDVVGEVGRDLDCSLIPAYKAKSDEFADKVYETSRKPSEYPHNSMIA